MRRHRILRYTGNFRIGADRGRASAIISGRLHISQLSVGRDRENGNSIDIARTIDVQKLARAVDGERMWRRLSAVAAGLIDPRRTAHWSETAIR